jgi:murein DD-endopeptidase MepM/ murein hydrolase activator NlpD
MEKPRPKLIERLKYKYRLVVMNDSTFEEKASVTLTPMNLFVVLSVIITLFTIIVSSLIIFTPLKEYIPGFADYKMRRDINLLLEKTDSLENEIRIRDNYFRPLNNIINGRDPADTTPVPEQETGEEAVPGTEQGSTSFLPGFYAEELPGGETQGAKRDISNFSFFPPLKGIVSGKFNLKEDHSAIDIVSKPDEAVKATLEGRVIFSSWTSEAGHVIGLQHPNNLVSIYKHNAVLLKKVGTFVNAGDAIAIVGNSGEYTSGPHLHFELWYNGNAINPEDYMIF